MNHITFINEYTRAAFFIFIVLGVFGLLCSGYLLHQMRHRSDEKPKPPASNNNRDASWTTRLWDASSRLRASVASRRILVEPEQRSLVSRAWEDTAP